jgi:sugar phosphate isomerase/epimerase
MAKYRISFQLYSARKFPPLDPQLDILAKIGFDAVEAYGGAYLADPKGFRAKCDKAGLKIPTAHVQLAELDGDRAKAIDTAKILGLETVIVPAVPQDRRTQDVAGWKALGAKLAGHADALKKAGLKFAWHNHAFEYVKLPDGSRPIEHLLQGAGVMWEPDLGWIVRAGSDIATELAKFPGKVAAFHIKDLAPAGVTVDDGWTDIGAGTIDWKKLWPAIERSGSDLLVFEHDAPSNWRSFAENSYKYVAGLIGRKKG